MRTQVVKVSYREAQYKVVHDDKAKINPFRVYYIWSELTEYGLMRRQKQVAKYADLPSCLFYLYDEISRNNMTENTIVKETFRRR